MIRHIKISIALSSALISACAMAPSIDAPMTKISRDYESNGNATGIHPFVYGKRTLIELKEAPIWLSIPFLLKVKDENGDTVDYKKDGRYYSMDRILDHFTVSTGVRTVTFSLSHPKERTEESVTIDEITPESTNTHIVNTAALITPPDVSPIKPPRNEEPIFGIMKEQLGHYRQLLKHAEHRNTSTAEELQAINNKLDSLDKKMMEGIAFVHVYFTGNSVIFRPDDAVLNALLPAAKNANKVCIYGRTNTSHGGRFAKSIAQKRAVNTKLFLIKNGIAEEKIQISSLGAGDFIAESHSKEGKLLNRRVEIELINNQ